MTAKLTGLFGESRMFELKKGLYIHEGNYEDFLKMYNLALQRNKADFPFRNDQGVLYKIEVAFVDFVLNVFKSHDHSILVNDVNKYKQNEEKLYGEELEQAQKELTEEFDARQEILDKKGLIYDTDGQVANKTPIQEWRRTLLKKHQAKLAKQKKNKNK